MLKCAQCHGFIPTHAKACPNCRSKKVSSCLKSGASVVGMSMIGLTLMACYGAPPDYYKSRPPLPPQEHCKDNDCGNVPEHKDSPDKTEAE